VSGWAVLINKLVHIPPYRGYDRTMPWERGFYEALGVRWFKRLVNSGWYRALWGPVLRRAGKSGSLESLASDMRAAGTAHLMALVVRRIPHRVFGFHRASCGHALADGMQSSGECVPIMLQRYNRGRIEGIMGRERRAGSPQNMAPTLPSNGL